MGYENKLFNSICASFLAFLSNHEFRLFCRNLTVGENQIKFKIYVFPWSASTFYFLDQEETGSVLINPFDSTARKSFFEAFNDFLQEILAVDRN